MGPYCKFCGQRCFVHFPTETPDMAIASYRPGVTIIATCPAGQAFERQETGWCYDMIHAAIERGWTNTKTPWGDPLP
jgi:hypothetical protein